MNKLLVLLIACFCLSSCLKDGVTIEYDPTLMTLEGKWEQQGGDKAKRHYMEFTEKTMKLYLVGENNKINYLINGNYIVIGDSINARDLTTNTYRNYYFELPTCQLMFFDEFIYGFRKK